MYQTVRHASRDYRPNAPQTPERPIPSNTSMFNLKLALRTLFRTPFVTAVAILSLGLGIGANGAIFSLFNQILLRPLPVADPGSLVNLSAPGPKSGMNFVWQRGPVRGRLQPAHVPRPREAADVVHGYRGAPELWREPVVQGPVHGCVMLSRYPGRISRCSA